MSDERIQVIVQLYPQHVSAADAKAAELSRTLRVNVSRSEIIRRAIEAFAPEFFLPNVASSSREAQSIADEAA